MTGLPTSVRTVGCGLDSRVLSTLLLRDVPLTRQGVRATSCVKKNLNAAKRCSPGHSSTFWLALLLSAIVMLYGL